MTESELLTRVEFGDLPVRSAGHPAVRDIEHPNDPTVFTGGIYEAFTLEEVDDYLARDDCAPAGVIRYEDEDVGEYVSAVFWERR